jgi:hypothetical protein
MFKKVLLLLIIMFWIISFNEIFASNAADDWIRSALLDITDSDVTTKVKDDDWFWMLAWIINWVKESLTWVLVLIAIWAFLFIWVRLAFARWNPEEFKKWMMHLVYAVIWIFIVSIAWAAVKLISGIDL